MVVDKKDGSEGSRDAKMIVASDQDGDGLDKHDDKCGHLDLNREKTSS